MIYIILYILGVFVNGKFIYMAVKDNYQDRKPSDWSLSLKEYIHQNMAVIAFLSLLSWVLLAVVAIIIIFKGIISLVLTIKDKIKKD